MQNGWLGIPYYQQFVEFPIHIINFNGGEKGEVWEISSIDKNKKILGG
jgi:hypothetical protein